MRLYGTEQTTMDDKGRTAFPTRFRDAVQKIYEANGLVGAPPTLMLVPWFDDGCLRAYPLPVFERKVAQFEQALANESAFERGRNESWLVRALYGDAREITPDGAGRVLLVAEIREPARLEREVMWKGLLDCIEIWNPQIYREAMAVHAPTARGVLASYGPPPGPAAGVALAPATPSTGSGEGS